MSNLPYQSLCCGCSACFAVCPKQAISMQADHEGFLQPILNKSECVQCNLCEKVCPVLHPNETREPLIVYAAKAKDDELRMKSSSGGIFSLLAREMFKDGGIVYGAGWERPAMRVIHKSAENEEELEDLRGAKYVQSDMGNIYQQVKEQLKTDRQVMFTGTPCQIAGLKHFLQKEYANLLCVDVICHAVPSPLVFQRYLEERESIANAKVQHISFRNKSQGWKQYSIELIFSNGIEYRMIWHQNPFLLFFVKGLYNRKSCHQCAVRELRCGSDLTIADYWGVDQSLPEMDDDKGTSVVLVNSIKGHQMFDELKLIKVESVYHDMKKCNPSVIQSSLAHSKRIHFFNMIQKGNTFDRTIERVLRRPLYQRILSFSKQQIKRVLPL